MFKFNEKDISYNLIEMSQINPLRWRFLFKEEDGSFTAQAPWMKCKDYFNDVVAKVKGDYNMKVYGFDNQNIKVNEEGFYVQLKDIQAMDTFKHNLEILNIKLQEQLQCEVSFINDSDTTGVLLIPQALLENTYRISLTTLCVRLSNYKVKFACWEDFWKRPFSPIWTTDKALHYSQNYIQQAASFAFELPEELEKFWFWTGSCNSENKGTFTPEVIHNCGVMSYKIHMDVEGIKCDATAATTC